MVKIIGLTTGGVGGLAGTYELVMHWKIVPTGSYFWIQAGSLSVVLLSIALVLVGLGLYFGALWTQPAKVIGRCHYCGYDLAGLPRSGVCPECGGTTATTNTAEPDSVK